MGKVLSSQRFCLATMRFVHEAGETLPQKQKWSYSLPGVFLSANSLNGVITFE